MSEKKEKNLPENENKIYRINEGASTSKSLEYTNRYKKQHYDNSEENNFEIKQYESNLLPNPSTSNSTIDLNAAKDSTQRLRIRNILFEIYNHTLHDDWFQARDLMLSSRLQETIQHSDRSTQILYNRTMVHLGLCAFRHAKVKEAHSCLVNLIKSRKPKDLLGQGFLSQQCEEEEEKEYEMPFQMLVNLELLECVYLVASMLIDVPYLVAHEIDIKPRRISHLFYQLLCSSESQSLVGPPESMRDHVVAAAKALRNGNWSACNNFIINEKMNGKVWNLFYQSDEVRAMLTKLIKEESLKIYLFTYSHVYDTISIATLAEMFELKKAIVHSTISKMIINEELGALLDGPTQTVVMQNKSSPLHYLAVQLIDKINNFMDLNEKMFEKNKSRFLLERRERGQFQKRKAKVSRKQ